MPPIATEPPPDQPVGVEPIAKPSKFTLKRIILLMLLVIILLAATIGAYYAVSIGRSLGNFANKCNQGSELATAAAPRLQAKLDSLNLGDDTSIKATSTKYGDCIDASSFTAEAKIMYLVPNSALLEVHQTLQARLQKRGYTPKKTLSIDEIKQIVDNVTASEVYAAPEQTDLHISYIVTPHDPNSCSQAASVGADAYTRCFEAYKAAYADLSALKTTSYTVSMSQEFPSQ
jgi:hypothetical protein